INFYRVERRKGRTETIFLIGIEVFKKKSHQRGGEGRMKKKVTYMTIAILVLLISVIRIFGEPDEDIYETQPATHLVG
ncbi:TPA: hypothetical protein ACHVAK_001820, partial [Streptococcus suis]